MRAFHKQDFPVDQIRRFLEPGPVVLVSSAWKGHTNIMTLGWHTVLEFSPSLIGCMISSGNASHEMIKRSGECVINIPTFDLIRQAIRIGNSTGDRIDKFEAFGLTPVEADRVKAPLIKECYANFECQVVDRALVPEYNFFVFEVLKAHVATAPKYPQTFHYRGDGVFMVSGRNVSFRSMFKPENL